MQCLSLLSAVSYPEYHGFLTLNLFQFQDRLALQDLQVCRTSLVMAQKYYIPNVYIDIVSGFRDLLFRFYLEGICILTIK